MNLISAKTRVFGLFFAKEIMTLALFVLIQYQSVTDGQTHRRTDRQTDRRLYNGYASACIACYATVLVKTTNEHRMHNTIMLQKQV